MPSLILKLHLAHYYSQPRHSSAGVYRPIRACAARLRGHPTLGFGGGSVQASWKLNQSITQPIRARIASAAKRQSHDSHVPHLRLRPRSETPSRWTLYINGQGPIIVTTCIHVEWWGCQSMPVSRVSQLQATTPTIRGYGSRECKIRLPRL
jgi:hypothetical protein